MTKEYVRYNYDNEKQPIDSITIETLNGSSNDIHKGLIDSYNAIIITDNTDGEAISIPFGQLDDYIQALKDIKERGVC